MSVPLNADFVQFGILDSFFPFLPINPVLHFTGDGSHSCHFVPYTSLAQSLVFDETVATHCEYVSLEKTGINKYSK
jgi:hypothetical protein